MNDAEARELETIRALVEYTWKQENIDSIRADIREYVERITGEVREQVAGRVLAESVADLELRIAEKVKEELQAVLSNEVAGNSVPSAAGRQGIRTPTKVLLALGLGFAGIGLGIAIAALSGLLR